MTLDKAAVLILTAVVAIFLGIVLFGSDPEGQESTTDVASNGGGGGAMSRSHSLDDLREAVGEPRRGRPVNFDSIRSGDYRTQNTRRKTKTDNEGPSSATRLLPRFKTVAVRPNETLSSIAKRELGNGEYFRRILSANPGLNPARLQIGQLIKIPLGRGRTESVASASGKKKSGATKASSSARYHTVTNGETLSGIAKKFYGKASRWKKILDANSKILPRPTALRVGMVLLIP
jgi:LysM repeat protein